MRSSGPLKTFSFDLMRVRPIRALVGWAGFPYVFPVAMLFAFVALAVLSWGRTAPHGVPDKLYAKTNLVQLLIWGLWWPGIGLFLIVVATAFGLREARLADPATGRRLAPAILVFGVAAAFLVLGWAS